MLGKQQVHEYAVVVFGIPHALLAKERDCTVAHHVFDRFATRDVSPQVARGEAGLHAQADLAGVFLLAGADASLESFDARFAECKACIIGVEPEVAQASLQQFHHHPPDAPPPPKLPPPPERNPPPPLRPPKSPRPPSPP